LPHGDAVETLDVGKQVAHARQDQANDADVDDSCLVKQLGCEDENRNVEDADKRFDGPTTSSRKIADKPRGTRNSPALPKWLLVDMSRTPRCGYLDLPSRKAGENLVRIAS
jgi:hypothetical protein